MFFLGVGTAVIGAASGNIGLTPFQTGLLVSVQNVGFIVAVLSAGALADAMDKPLLMSAGSFVLAASFFLYYLWRPYPLNLAIMGFIGIGIGTYEGVADAMLLSIHDRRGGLHISVNHFFVTFGCLAISLYMVFLQMDWRSSMVQSAIVVLVLAVVFALSRVVGGRSGAANAQAAAVSAPGFRQRIAFLGKQRILGVLLLLAAIAVGIESGLLALLPGFLRELRGYDLAASKIGLVLFLAGDAAGRVLLGFLSGRLRIAGSLIVLSAATAACSALLLFVHLTVAATALVLILMGMAVSSLLPLLITMTGTLFKDVAGTALGIMKLGIPIGGIVVPALVSVASRIWSFQISLAIIPALAAVACVALAASGKTIRARLAAVG
jgi:MFS family permease